MPRMKSAKKPRSKKGGNRRRSHEEAKAIVGEVDALVAGGSTIKDALAKLGVSYSNYNYWRKREGLAGKRRRKARTRSGRTPTRSITTILAEMTKNRQEHDAARRRADELDTRYTDLKKRLEKAGG